MNRVVGTPLAIGRVASILLTAGLCAGTLAAFLAAFLATSPGIPIPGSRISGPPSSNPVFPLPASIPNSGRLDIPGIKRYQRVEIDSKRLTGMAERLHHGPLPLNLGAGMRWDLELERISVRASGYRVRLLGT